MQEAAGSTPAGSILLRQSASAFGFVAMFLRSSHMKIWERSRTGSTSLHQSACAFDFAFHQILSILMLRHKILIAIAIMEILIGVITLCAIVFSLITNFNTKTANVLIFVITTSCLSVLLGIGLLSSKKWLMICSSIFHPSLS